MRTGHALARGLLVGASLVLLAAGCSGGDSQPRADTDVGAPRTEAGEPDQPRAGDLRWQSPPVADQVIGVTEAGDGFAVITTGETLGLDADGTRRWVLREPGDRRRRDATWAGDVVLRFSAPSGPDAGDQTGPRIRVIDLRTGQVGWRATVVRETAVVATQESIYLGSCSSDECTVAARVPDSGAVRWRTPVAAGLSHVEHVGDAVHVTSFPDGTDRTGDPYGERTAHLVLDARTGEPLGPERRGNAFHAAAEVLIEASYRRSDGSDCSVTYTGRSLDGDDLWTRTFDWRRGEREPDCAIADRVQVLGGDRIEVSAPGGFGQVLDAATGRTRGRHGGARHVLDTHDGVDLVVNAAFDRFVGRDLRSGERLWQVLGEHAGYDGPDGYFQVKEDPAAVDDRIELRSIGTGEISLRFEGVLVGSGADWAATVTQDGRDLRVSLLDWPH